MLSVPSLNSNVKCREEIASCRYTTDTKYSSAALSVRWHHIMLGAVLLVSAVRAQAENKWVWSGSGRTISGGGSAGYYPDEAARQSYRYCADQVTWYLSPLTLRTVVVITVRSLLGVCRHGQATLSRQVKCSFYCNDFHETHDTQWHFVDISNTEFHVNRLRNVSYS